MMDHKTTQIRINHTPRIKGLSFRGFRGEQDFPEMLKVFKSAMTGDGIEDSTTLEDVSRDYQHLDRSNPYNDMLFAQLDGELVAYGRCWWDAEPNDIYRYAFFVNLRPEWRGKGIGKAIAHHLIKRLETISDDHPSHADKYLQGWANDKQQWQQNLLVGLGMQPFRYGYMMVRPCSQPIDPLPLPVGLEVRPVSPDQFRQVWDAQIEAFRDHWGFVEPTENNYQNWLEFPHSNPDLWKVAWDGDQVAGMVLNFINHEENQEYHRKRGYTEDISVRRPWRRQGVARALLTQSIHMFQQMGMEETVLGVDANNPNGALRLYESAGYTPYRTTITYRKPLNENEKRSRS